MIIFDLDGTLADCEHRQHFVNPPIDVDEYEMYIPPHMDYAERPKHHKYIHKETGKLWNPNWESFYEACDKDQPIQPTIRIFHHCLSLYKDIQIWSGRCETVREKTIDWLYEHVGIDFYCDGQCPDLKMRPEGDSTADDELKEKWLDEALTKGKKIKCLFDSDPKSIRMWRRRGIFVFNCCQHDGEF